MAGLSRNGRQGRSEDFGLPAGQVAGFSILIAALLVLLLVFPGQIELIIGAAVALAGTGRLVIGHLEAGENDALPPASRAFRELADPARPLPPPVEPAPPAPEP